MNFELTSPQTAVQLIGPDQLQLNENKSVPLPGPHQILCKVEAVGLCFSDLKLLKQFSNHARKTEILDGIEQSILKEVPSYVPDSAPTVPGHEAVVRICALGELVESVQLGQRYLVQTDYRWLPTANSNGSFGYNFEGALQQFVLMDERVITSPQGESMLIPASEDLSASAIGLVEPWACVEDAYRVQERQSLKIDGKMAVVSDTKFDPEILVNLFNQHGKPAEIAWIAPPPQPDGWHAYAQLRHVSINRHNSIADLKDATFDDIIYFGSQPDTAQALMPKVAPQGLLNLVLSGSKFHQPVITEVGRVHYGGIRIIGTTGSNPADSFNRIPSTGEIRPHDKINVIGAGGPMGVMHVIRNICSGVADVSVFAGDISKERLESLNRIAQPLAQANSVSYTPYDPTTDNLTEPMNYTVLMAPIPKLVTEAVQHTAPHGIINIFAGIPASVTAEIDLDLYIENQLYFIGTSGSVLEDMKVVLEKVESGQLDTNLSVGAVTGLAGALEGIRAVENQTITGKIIVYPACKNLPLTQLSEMPQSMPDVAAQLNQGLWTKTAENTLLKKFS
jgi:threonine dehydrogenase-like Zn-dependent dehydrogenase